MAIQLINVGNVANDGTGDDLREAFIKINNNFEEIDLRDDEQTTASNIGVGEGIFANRVNYDLQFKSLVSGQNINLTSTDNGITIDAVGGLQQLIVSSDSGSVILADGNTLNIVGGTGVSTSLLDNTLTITNTESSLALDDNPTLSATLNADNFDILNVGNLLANSINGPVNGNVTGLVHNIDIRTLQQEVSDLSGGFDFGEIVVSVANILEWLLASTDVDMGTFNQPDPKTIDAGSI